MIPTWLYSTDGRALYCVCVQTPMPRAVTYANQMFVWDTEQKKYIQAQVYHATEAPKEGRPNA